MYSKKLLFFDSLHDSLNKQHTSAMHAPQTINSAIADKPRDAFTGQSRSLNTVPPFHKLGMISY